MSASEKLLHIDTPVNLAEVKVAFNVGALALKEICRLAFSTSSSSKTTSPIGTPGVTRLRSFRRGRSSGGCCS